MTERIPAIVTGLGCLTAAGLSVGATIESLFSGRRHVRGPMRVEHDLDYDYPVFEILSELDVEIETLARSSDFGAIDLSREPTRVNKLALLAAVEAAREAGYSIEHLRKMRVGIAVGTTVGSTLNNEPFFRAWRKREKPDIDPVRKYRENNPALYLSHAFGTTGPAQTLVNACSSGSDAIGLARQWIEDDLVDIAIAGGSDKLSRITYLGFTTLMIASKEACKPFDRWRNGLNLGEGAGMVCIEAGPLALRRGAQPLARVAGYATYSDAYHPTAPHPEGRGLRRAISSALSQAGVGPKSIDFVNAHGTSTPDNDKVEGSVLSSLLRHDAEVVSTKAYTGHTLGAAGGIEAALTIRALNEGRIPATLGFEEYDPDCRLRPTRRNTEVGRRVALSNSLAFGGTNSVLVFTT
jgi:3-oxoacyl-[acyl-carrier-protein] synthase II